MKHRGGVARAIISSLAVAFLLLGCGPGGAPTTKPGGATSAPGDAAGAFCDAAARLELADASNRQSIQAGLEANTPAGLADAVAVIRTFMERQASGNDPNKDPEFLLTYDHAVRDIWKACGLHQG
ncbi:MAG TPA: hypothetical protein VHK64_02205 [Nocardioidaceae bacterium]|jgi:hypothetical protein|nr:hypothetical protein [Nocardioidaceae bacterium]